MSLDNYFFKNTEDMPRSKKNPTRKLTNKEVEEGLGAKATSEVSGDDLQANTTSEATTAAHGAMEPDIV